MAATGGWKALRGTTWSPEINDAFIDGAIDAGKPIKLVTPLGKIRPNSVTSREIDRVRSRGGNLITPE